MLLTDLWLCSAGAQGVDLIERTSGSTVTTGFPLYDPDSPRSYAPLGAPGHAHGNNVATLSRAGTGYAVNDRRSYDAWGVVRAQQSGGDPKLRYCASLGHKQDDESGLVTMRARYYEPQSGRFLSEDDKHHGNNWFVYASCNPVKYVDASGRESIVEVGIANGEGTSMEGAMNEICADFFPEFNEGNGTITNMTHSDGLYGSLKEAVMRVDPSRVDDWEYISQIRFGNGPGSGLLKALVRFNGQLVDAYLDATADELGMMYGVPYMP